MVHKINEVYWDQFNFKDIFIIEPPFGFISYSIKLFFFHCYNPNVCGLKL